MPHPSAKKKDLEIIERPAHRAPGEKLTGKSQRSQVLPTSSRGERTQPAVRHALPQPCGDAKKEREDAERVFRTAHPPLLTKDQCTHVCKLTRKIQQRQAPTTSGRPEGMQSFVRYPLFQPCERLPRKEKREEKRACVVSVKATHTRNKKRFLQHASYQSLPAMTQEIFRHPNTHMQVSVMSEFCRTRQMQKHAALRPSLHLAELVVARGEKCSSKQKHPLPHHIEKRTGTPSLTGKSQQSQLLATASRDETMQPFVCHSPLQFCAFWGKEKEKERKRKGGVHAAFGTLTTPKERYQTRT